MAVGSTGGSVGVRLGVTVGVGDAGLGVGMGDANATFCDDDSKDNRPWFNTKKLSTQNTTKLSSSR